MFCREEALDFLSLFSTESMKGFTPFAVIKETIPTKQCADDDCLGVGAFARDYFTAAKENMIIDRKLTWYNALGNRKLYQQSLTTWNPFTFVSNLKETKARGTAKGVTDSNLKGEGLTQGGIIVFNKEGGVEFLYKEKTGFEIPKEEIVAACMNVKSKFESKKANDLVQQE